MQDDNSLTAVGKALALFGKYFEAGTIVSIGSSQAVRSWAVKPSSTSWVLIFLNKGFTTTQQDVTVSNCALNNIGAVWQLTGTNYTDLQPTLKKTPNSIAQVANGKLSIVLPPVSITAIEL